MNLKGQLRWFVVIIAIPVGLVVGFFCGYYLCCGVLYLQGKGNSHDDVYSVIGSGGLGSVIGALLLPIITWLTTRGRKT